MSEYTGVVTLKGQEKLAASIGGTPLNITTIRVGDGNGAPITPTASMTDLVRRVGTAYPITSSGRDPANPQAWRVTTIIPESAGPFDIREIGAFDAAGDMIAIAKHVVVEKRTPAQGAAVALITDIVFPVSETAQVTINVSNTERVDIAQLCRPGFLVVESATVTSPPGAPAIGRTHVVPTGATGAWAGYAGWLAQYNGTVWAMANPPEGFLVVVGDVAVGVPERWRRRTAGGWVNATASEAAFGATILATKADLIAGSSSAKAAHPSSVAKAVQAGAWRYDGVAAGSGGSVTVILSPAPDELTEGMEVTFKAPFTNTGPLTLNPNGLGAKPMVRPDGSALSGGEMTAGRLVSVKYDGASWQMSALKTYMPNGGTFGVLGTFGNTGTTAWTVPAGVTKVRVRAWGAGGGGGGSASSPSAASGGGGGGYVEGYYPVTPGQVINVTAGLAGPGAAAVSQGNGNPGGTSSFGTLCSAGGGGGGGGAAATGYQTEVGAGGAATGGNVFNISGSAGQPGRQIGSNGVGGVGGHAHASAGAPLTTSHGSAGTTPGGGGSGGANSGGGGSGGHGIVYVEW